MEAVREIYKLDFDLFHYDRDIQNLRPHRSEIANQTSPDLIQHLIALFGDAPEAEKRQRLAQVAAGATPIDIDYLRFATVPLSLEDKIRATKELVVSGSSNWRYACELTADLVRAGAAASTVHLFGAFGEAAGKPVSGPTMVDVGGRGEAVGGTEGIAASVAPSLTDAMVARAAAMERRLDLIADQEKETGSTLGGVAECERVALEGVRESLPKERSSNSNADTASPG
jgi:hypothetical protein